MRIDRVPVLVACAAVGTFLIPMTDALAQQVALEANSPVDSRKIFTLLFLMLGPIKILGPFVTMTQGADATFRFRLATRALLYAAAALAVAGLMGNRVLENFSVPLPVLALTGGLVLFLVALQTVLQQFQGGMPRPGAEVPPPTMHLAFSPLAFPTIVTPYGVAAVIIFTALAQQHWDAELALAGIVAAILLLDWITMLFAHVILRYLGPALQIFAVVLGVTQVAIGLDVILRSLSTIGVFAMRLP
ncbi:MAG: MarC family protein [Acetobacteraceae bacterium]